MNIGIYKEVIIVFFFLQIWLFRFYLFLESIGRISSEGSDRVILIKLRDFFLDFVMIDFC